MFFHNKKGFEAGVIIAWLIALAILVIILVAVIPRIPLFAGSVSQVASCGGASIGGKQGVCVSESRYCNEKIVSGCEKYPGSPVCCFDATVIAEVSATKYCLCYENSERKTVLFHKLDYPTADECKNDCENFCSALGTDIFSCVSLAETEKPVRCRESNICYSSIARCDNTVCAACTFDSTC